VSKESRSKWKNLLGHLSDTCCTSILQVSDTDQRSVGKWFFFLHWYELSDTYHRSVIQVSDTATRLIIEMSVLHRYKGGAPYPNYLCNCSHFIKYESVWNDLLEYIQPKHFLLHFRKVTLNRWLCICLILLLEDSKSILMVQNWSSIELILHAKLTSKIDF
jgi:hypothetical protein